MMLPHELLVKIFYSLERRPQHHHSSTSSISFSSSLSIDRTDILACALVCQDWYYAAVDTLWRDVDLQSVESFIQFGMILDPSFSYIKPSPRLNYSQQRYQDCSDVIDNGNNEDNRSMDQEQQLSIDRVGRDNSHWNNSHRSSININASRSTTIVTSSRIGTAALLSSSSSSSMSSSTSGMVSTSLSSTCSDYSLSSLEHPCRPGQIGYAGKGYIRTFSLAGTTDCLSPRPFPFLPSCITDRHLNTISPSLTHLTSISLSYCTALTDMAVIQLITSSSPYLKKIDLTECRLLTNLTVQVIAGLCNQLEDLSLQGCGLVTDDAIEEVALNCPRLHSINIGQCQRAGDKSLDALLRASRRMNHLDPVSKTRIRNAQLKRLAVAGCRGVTYAGLSAITEQLSENDTAEMAIHERPSLISLDFSCPAVKASIVENLNGLSISTTAMAVSSASRSVSQASRFFRSLPTSLEEISIHDSYTLSHSDIITLIDQVGPGLKVLRFDHANAINSETLSHVLAVCTNLTVLSIPRASRLDDAGVIQLIGAKCAGSLVELDLSACHSLSDGCLTALAKSIPATPSRPLVLHENDKGKAIQEPNDPCLFPNLRRLDLSYNCKMTLSGIIPLVMSLKNLCALDVSFCGDGVTRSWSSNLESLRHSLSPSSSSVVDSAGIDDLFGETVIESDHSEDEEPSTGSQHQYRQYHQNSLYQEQQQQVHPRTGSTTTSSSPSQQYGLSSQNLQRFANNVAPLMNTSRIGLGRYVGPILDHNTGTNFTNNLNNISYNNSISPQHPQQLTGLGDNIIDQFSPGDRRRSSASSMASSSSMSSISSGSSSNLISDSSSASYSGSRSNSTYTHNRRRSSCSRILLADRLDVLENTPRRVGIPASFYLESWFTPQHQLQLQHLLQIQVQHQRDLQEVQAQAAMAQATATALNGAFQHQQQFGAAIGAFANMMPFAALSAEMMNHPVMSAIRVGTATVGSNNNGGGGGGYGIGHGGAGNGGNLFSQQPFESHNNSDANIYHHTNRRMGLGNDVGGTTRTGIRHHHRHHYQHPHYHRCNSSPNAIFGHCEISAWGLSKLREEWATVM